jgi:hypothetical protein
LPPCFPWRRLPRLHLACNSNPESAQREPTESAISGKCWLAASSGPVKSRAAGSQHAVAPRRTPPGWFHPAVSVLPGPPQNPCFGGRQHARLRGGADSAAERRHNSCARSHHLYECYGRLRSRSTGNRGSIQGLNSHSQATAFRSCAAVRSIAAAGCRRRAAGGRCAAAAATDAAGGRGVDGGVMLQGSWGLEAAVSRATGKGVVVEGAPGNRPPAPLSVGAFPRPKRRRCGCDGSSTVARLKPDPNPPHAPGNRPPAPRSVGAFPRPQRRRCGCDGSSIVARS